MTEHPAGQVALVHTTGFFAIFGEHTPLLQQFADPHFSSVFTVSNFITGRAYDLFILIRENKPRTGILYAERIPEPQEPDEHCPAYTGEDTNKTAKAKIIFFIFAPLVL